MTGPMTADPPSRRLGVALYDELKERLLAGRYPAGSRISIEEIKAQFRVSKQPVMDAMRRLEATGIVDIVPQSGCRVVEFSPREINDFFNLFGRFEGEIAAAAAARRSETQLLDLDEAWQRIADLEDRRDPEDRSDRYCFLNREYHSVIHRMSSSRVMAQLSARMWDLSDFLINTTGVPQPLSSALDERHADHEDIRDALHARDQATARSAMEHHIVGTVTVIHAEARSSIGAESPAPAEPELKRRR